MRKGSEQGVDEKDREDPGDSYEERCRIGGDTVLLAAAVACFLGVGCVFLANCDDNWEVSGAPAFLMFACAAGGGACLAAKEMLYERDAACGLVMLAWSLAIVCIAGIRLFGA